MQTSLLAAAAIYVVDAVALLVILVFAAKASRKGFVDCLFGLISTVGAFVITLLFTKSFLSLTGGLFGLQGVFAGSFEKTFSEVVGFNIDVSAQGIENALADKNLPAFLLDMIMENFQGSDIPYGTTLAMLVGGELGKLAATLLAGVALFFIAKLVLRVLKNVISGLVQSIPIVGTVDSALGFVVGILHGVLIVSLAIAVLALIPSESVSAFFSEGILVNFLFHNNPIHVVLGWIVG